MPKSFTLRINGAVPEGWSVSDAVRTALNNVIYELPSGTKDTPLDSWGEIENVGEYHFESDQGD